MGSVADGAHSKQVKAIMGTEGERKAQQSLARITTGLGCITIPRVWCRRPPDFKLDDLGLISTGQELRMQVATAAPLVPDRRNDNVTCCANCGDHLPFFSR